MIFIQCDEGTKFDKFEEVISLEPRIFVKKKNYKNATILL